MHKTLTLDTRIASTYRKSLLGLYYTSSNLYTHFLLLLFLELFLPKNCFVNRVFNSKNKKILSIEFFLDLSVILRKILRIFVYPDPDLNFGD